MVFAHPDDAEWGLAGTVARWVRDGTEVEYVCVTDGSAGSNDPATTRERLVRSRREEQEAAGRVLGVSRCTFLGFVDGALEVSLDLRRAITREVRRFRPDVLVAPDPARLWDRGRTYVNHPDHKAVGVACLAVVNPDAPTRPQFPELLAEGYEPFEIPNLWMSTGDDPDTYVDITGTIDVKAEALRCHASQIHDWPVEDWLRARAKETAASQTAASQGTVYAEAFRTFRLKDAEDPDEAR